LRSAWPVLSVASPGPEVTIAHARYARRRNSALPFLAPAARGPPGRARVWLDGAVHHRGCRRGDAARAALAAVSARDRPSSTLMNAVLAPVMLAWLSAALRSEVSERPPVWPSITTMGWGCGGAEAHSAERIRWYHDMQWHHADSRRSARQTSPGSTTQVFLSFREFCTASKVAWRRTLFPWDKATIDAYIELCERTGRAHPHSQLPFDVRVQCLPVCYSSYVSTNLPTCVGDSTRARRTRFRRAVPPLRREHIHTTLPQTLPLALSLSLPLLLALAPARLRLPGASCLSYAEAVAPGLYANRTGFTLDDVAADCLHPNQGRYGNAYASDILRNWLRQAARRVSSALTAAGPAEAWRLPPPCNATDPAAVRGADKVLRLQTEADGRCRPRPALCTVRCTLRCAAAPLCLCTSAPLRLCASAPLHPCAPVPLCPCAHRQRALLLIRAAARPRPASALSGDAAYTVRTRL